MPQAITSESASATPPVPRTLAPELAGAFDSALERAIGRASAAGVGGVPADAVGNPQDLRPAAQETAKPRKSSAEDAKPKNLTQLSVAELAALPTASSVAREAVQSPSDASAAPQEAPRASNMSPDGSAARGESPKAGSPALPDATHPPSKDQGTTSDARAGTSGGTKPLPQAAPAVTPASAGPNSAVDENQSSVAAVGAAPSAPGAQGVPASAAQPSAAVASGSLPAAEGRSASEPGGSASPQATDVKTITGAKSKALLAGLESSSRGKFVIEDDEPLTQVSRGLSLALRQGGNATLRLSPGSLGDLTIHLNIRDDQVTARLEPTSESARQLLEAKSHELWAALEARGLSVERIEIDGSRIGQEFGAMSQDADNAPKDRADRGPARRGDGAEPREIELDSLMPQAAPVSLGHDGQAVYRLRLDAIA